jgi:hypothetical protein
MEFKLDSGETAVISDRTLIKAIDNAYSSWYFFYDKEIEDPDKIMRLGLDERLLKIYEQSRDMQRKMQYVIDYTVNKSYEFVALVRGRPIRTELRNTDGTPVTREQFRLIKRLSSWTRNDLFP